MSCIIMCIFYHNVILIRQYILSNIKVIPSKENVKV